MKIFWSWQYDTHGKTSRYLIREALDEAVEQLRVDAAVDEPFPRDMHVDSDRQGISGSTDLANEIFKKIAASDIIVADVTPVGVVVNPDDSTRPLKHLMNPNVAIELGYGLHVLSEYNLIMVMNRHYGGPETLPFDLRQKSFPITYDLAPSANKQARIDAKKRLVSAFVRAIGLCLDVRSRPRPPAFNRTSASFTEGVFFEENELLLGDTPNNATFRSGEGFYLRLLPQASQIKHRFSKQELKRAFEDAPAPMGEKRPEMPAFNRYGAVVFKRDDDDDGYLAAITQVFDTGELWGFTKELVIVNSGGRYAYFPRVRDALTATLRDYLRFMASINIVPPYRVIAGAAGLQGVPRITFESDTPGGDKFTSSKIAYEATLQGDSWEDIDGFLREAGSALWSQ